MIAALAMTALSACSLAPGGSGDADDAVVLISHDSFAVSQEVLDEFEDLTGKTVEVRTVGDAGAMVNQLALTKDSPLGDVVYGIDNTFASRALDEGILEAYEPAGVDDQIRSLAVDDSSRLTAVDYSDVCVNVDREWFADADLPEPVTLQDLTEPAYRDLLVVEDPASSSPGLAFLLGTIGAFGADGWEAYWADLRDNGVKVAANWTDAYYVDFSGPSSEGIRPLVVSYASSPPYEVLDDSDVAPTAALLQTCFRQVEYAGVLAGAADPEGAGELMDFLISRTFQEDIPENMYVYPALAGAELPADWVAFAPLADEPFTVAAADIAANRQLWIDRWTDIVIG